MDRNFSTLLTGTFQMPGFGKALTCPAVNLCLVIMLYVCGLFGLFEKTNAQIYLIAESSPGISAAGARAGIVLPAFSAIRS